MENMKRIIGLFLVMCMMVSISAVAIIPSSAASSDLQLAQDTVDGGAVSGDYADSFKTVMKAMYNYSQSAKAVLS